MNLQGQRIAVYARYSTDKQSAASIEDQLRVCREYVARAGGEVSNDLVFVDHGQSGASTARPGLQALQAAARAGLVDVVVTEDLSRLGRDQLNNLQMMRDLKTWGARLIAIQDNVDTKDGSASSKIMGALKSVMAETYLDELKARTKRGLDGRFDLGLNTGGRAYGYRSQPIPESNGSARWVVHEPEAVVVRRIFTEWCEGHPLRGIAERLNADAIAAPRGGQWQHITVRALLGNELYAGVVTFNRRAWSRDSVTGKRKKEYRPKSEWRTAERPELRIVDAETWHAAQERRASTSRAYKAAKRQKQCYPLSGLLYCQVCGGPMIIVGRSRYACSSFKRGTGCQNRASLREDAVRATLLDELQARISNPETIQNLRADFAASVGGRDRELREELRQRRTQLTQLEARLAKLLDLILDGDNGPTTRAKRAELEDHAELQRAAIIRLELAAAAVPTLPSPDRIRAFMASLHQVAAQEPAVARELVSELVGGHVQCEPPREPEGPYWLNFPVYAGAVIELAHSPVKGLWARGSCGGRILPQADQAAAVDWASVPCRYH